MSYYGSDDDNAVVEDQIEDGIKAPDPVLLALQSSKLPQRQDQTQASTVQAGTDSFDEITAALKEEAKALDIREQALLKREIELANREIEFAARQAEYAKQEDDAKLAAAAKALTLQAQAQTADDATSSATAAPEENKPQLSGFTNSISSARIRKYKLATECQSTNPSVDKQKTNRVQPRDHGW